MELSQIIQTIIVVFLFGVILLYFVLLCIYKKKANITIVKKRVNTHKGMDSTFSKVLYSNHYTVDCYVNKSSRLKTLTCEMDMYNRFKEGEKYYVLLGINSIIKIFHKV